MTLLTVGTVLLLMCIALAGLAVCAGHIPWLNRLLGGAPLEEEPDTDADRTRGVGRKRGTKE